MVESGDASGDVTRLLRSGELELRRLHLERAGRRAVGRPAERRRRLRRRLPRLARRAIDLRPGRARRRRRGPQPRGLDRGRRRLRQRHGGGDRHDPRRSRPERWSERSGWRPALRARPRHDAPPGGRPESATGSQCAAGRRDGAGRRSRGTAQVTRTGHELAIFGCMPGHRWTSSVPAESLRRPGPPAGRTSARLAPRARRTYAPRGVD